MPYTVKALPEGQIVHTTYSRSFPTGDELIEMDKALHAILETFDPNKRIYLLTDMTGIELTFSQLVQILSKVRQFNETWYENAEMLIVGQDDLVELATETLRQEKYGSHPTEFFTSVEAAMAYIKEQHPAYNQSMQ